MRRWELTYLGRSTFPKGLSEFELKRAFTFTDRERRDIRKAFRVKYRLAAALQFGFLRLTGLALGSVAYVPTAVLHHLGRQFRGPAPDLATLRALYRREATRFEHHRWAIEYSGLMKRDERGQASLVRELHERTHGTLSRSRLVQLAREWLFRCCYLIPSHRWMSVFVRRVVRAVVSRYGNSDHRESEPPAASARARGAPTGPVRRSSAASRSPSTVVRPLLPVELRQVSDRFGTNGVASPAPAPQTEVLAPRRAFGAPDRRQRSPHRACARVSQWMQKGSSGH